MSDPEPVAGVNVPAGVFPAALLGALIREAGGSITVSEEEYRREALRVMEGHRSRLLVDENHGDGRITVRISEFHAG